MTRLREKQPQRMRAIFTMDGRSHQQIMAEYPERTEQDIRAYIAYAAGRERRIIAASFEARLRRAPQGDGL